MNYDASKSAAAITVQVAPGISKNLHTGQFHIQVEVGGGYSVRDVFNSLAEAELTVAAIRKGGGGGSTRNLR